MSAGAHHELDIGGRRLAIRNLDRVVFPRTGTTKAQLLDYYSVPESPGSGGGVRRDR